MITLIQSLQTSDVFTGGAEPLELFTQEYLKELRNILRPDGIIAIVSYFINITLPAS